MAIVASHLDDVCVALLLAHLKVHPGLCRTFAFAASLQGLFVYVISSLILKRRRAIVDRVGGAAAAGRMRARMWASLPPPLPAGTG